MAKPDVPIATWVGPPRSYTSGRRSKQPTVIVIHTTEGSEGPRSAEDGAAYDKRRTDGTSTHFFVDSDSVVQEVEIDDEAHAARTHGNDIGIQIEVCGRAGQTDSQWADDASAATMENLAQLCVQLMAKTGIPAVRLSRTQLRSAWSSGSTKGFCGHIDITEAFPEDNGTHTDPGPHFPWAWLFARINQLENNMPKKRHARVDLDGNTIAEVKYGDDDRDFEGYWAVMRVQRLLYFEADGKTPLKPDGRYGSKTRDAVKARLAESNIASDGKKVGLAEWRVIAGFSAG